MRRSDDNAETLKKRLFTYHSQTAPLVDYYTKKRNLTTINAMLPKETVWSNLQSILDRSAALAAMRMSSKFRSAPMASGEALPTPFSATS